MNEQKNLDFHNAITLEELEVAKIQWVRWVQQRRSGDVTIGLETGKYPSAGNKNLSQQLGALFQIQDWSGSKDELEMLMLILERSTLLFYLNKNGLHYF